MKIISLHTKSQQQRKKAIKGDREAQEQIFKEHAPVMLSVCRQYVKDIHHAEDLMLQGFLKVFKNLEKFKNEGSFEGWIRKIMVNTCISYLRKKNHLEFTDEEYQFNDMVTHNIENTSVEDIQRLIDALPDGYKMVFNLYAIEGYKHHEIAKKLSISESTSKSQLFKARKWLQANYIKMNRIKDADR
ncbi:RNA polymerase sigma factor [Tenacibaculum sp. ZS6-P6]|uniref:RNA polymerase sigma factor n=1 Tax=Tenacibaculum sp. ZS6-P6 TaxID=3447503 RepID=UPI003F995306